MHPPPPLRGNHSTCPPSTKSSPPLSCSFAVLAFHSRRPRLFVSDPQTCPIPVCPAQLARESLESRPEAERTRRDYDHVLDLYRAIYHDDPASPKADASIFAVAQLLAEQGRILNDEKSLHDAIGQYEFLRREYPGSHYRADALLAEGDIYAHDLSENADAKGNVSGFPEGISAQRGALRKLAPI